MFSNTKLTGIKRRASLRTRILKGVLMQVRRKFPREVVLAASKTEYYMLQRWDGCWLTRVRGKCLQAANIERVCLRWGWSQHQYNSPNILLGASSPCEYFFIVLTKICHTCCNSYNFEMNTPFCCNRIEGTLCTAKPTYWTNNPNLPIVCVMWTKGGCLKCEPYETRRKLQWNSYSI